MRALRISSWIIAGLFLGIGLRAAVLAEPPLGRLQGRLVARDSGRPLVASVTLSVYSKPVHGSEFSPVLTVFTTRSDVDGRFSFEGIPIGAYLLDANSPGHFLADQNVFISEGKPHPLELEMVRRPSWLELVVHHHALYPGEPTAIAVRGLTLNPFYRLEIYRVHRWARVTQEEARAYAKALAAAVATGDLEKISSREKKPHHLDTEGVFYDRINLGKLEVGHYLVVATGETGSRSAEPLSISRLALLVKSDSEKAVAYISDAKSGAPIAGAEVTAGWGGWRRHPDAAGLEPVHSQSGVTDATGLAHLTLSSGTADITYTAHVGQDKISLDSWHYAENEQRYLLFAFTDRPIYRPGDEVKFKGVLRERIDGWGYRCPPNTTIQFQVTDEDDAEIYKASFTTNDQGSFAGSFTLPKHAKAGLYTMTSIGERFRFNDYLTVASYLKPELELFARPTKLEYVRGELATVEIRANYYFGAPAADLNLHWMLSRGLHYPHSGMVDEEWDYEDEGELMSEGDGRTDEAGWLRLTLPSQLPTGEAAEENNPYYDHVFTLHVWSTSEAGGQAEAKTRYLVTRGLFTLTVQPDKYILTPGKSASIKLKAQDFKGNPVANQQLSLSLIKETLEGAEQGRKARKVKRVMLTIWTATTGADGVAETSVTAPKEGQFVLEATTQDSQNHAIAVREHLWAASEDYWDFGEGQAELSIVSDRKQYQERDRAKLLVSSKHAGPGILSLEGDELHEMKPISLRRGVNLLEIQLKPEYLPNVFVWIGQVYDKELHQGQKEIRISREARRLNVKVTPGRSEYRPGKQATCEVQITDSKGKPLQTEVAIGVVDEAIYALAPDNIEDPADFFYYRSYNRVNTDFAPESYYLGGGDKAPTSIEVRRKFVDTAFWSPQVMTEAKGRAQVSFKLPDNLTSWRVTARAISADTHGGVGHVNFKVNKPLMVRLDLPRFATQGDRFRVSAFVHNETNRTLKVNLDSWARGMKLESRKKALTIPAHKVLREDWWATVTSPKIASQKLALQVDKAIIGALAVGGGLSDAVELTLPVNPLTKTQFDAWSGRTEGSTALILPLRDDAVLDRSQLTVAVSPSVAASLFSSLEYLVNYPYGCVEQTVSSFLPDLYILELLKARGMSELPFAKQIPTMLRDGLSRLSSLQREEGGWGWGRWGELDIWMTSYAMLALLEAKQAGYQATAAEQALPQLENALRSSHYEYPDDLAFSAYVLSRLKSELATATTLKALSDPKLSGRGRALCALAYFEQGKEVEAHKTLAELWRSSKREGEWTYWTGLQNEESRWWDGGANVEATAWALKATLRADAKDPRAASIAGWLLQQRRGDHWVSTRDTAIAIFALIEYLKQIQEPNPDYTVIVKLNDKEALRQVFTKDPHTWREVALEVPWSDLHAGANTLDFTRRNGSGRLYYRVNLRQRVPIAPGQKTAFGELFQVRREYFRMGRGGAAGALAYGPAYRPGDAFANNDRVLVRLTITSKQRLRYVLIEDSFPAGLEPSARGDIGFMDWHSWWVDNDVRDDRVTFYLDWLPAGERNIEYILAARTLGRFYAIPPNGFAMYQPKINALGNQALVEVRE